MAEDIFTGGGNDTSDSSQDSTDDSTPDESSTSESTQSDGGLGGGVSAGPGSSTPTTSPQEDEPAGGGGGGGGGGTDDSDRVARDPGSGGGGVSAGPGSSTPTTSPQEDEPAGGGQDSMGESQQPPGGESGSASESQRDTGTESGGRDGSDGAEERQRVEDALSTGAQAASVERLRDGAYRVETDPTGGSGPSPGPGSGQTQYVATTESGREYLESMAERREQYADVGGEMLDISVSNELIEAGQEARANAEAMETAQDITNEVFDAESPQPSPDEDTPEGQVATGQDAIENVTGDSDAGGQGVDTGESNEGSVDTSPVTGSVSPLSNPGQRVTVGESRGRQTGLDLVFSASEDATQLVTQGVVNPTAVGAGEVVDLSTDVATIPTDVATGQGIDVSTEGSGVAEDFTEDTVLGAGQVGTSLTVGAPLTARSVGETTVNAAEFAADNPTEVPEATVDVASEFTQSTIDTAQHRPGLLIGQFAAGAGVGSAAAKVAAGTRLMTGRTGSAISTVSKYDPGANAIRLGKRGVSGIRSRVSGSGSSASVVGRVTPGTRGTGTLLDADAVDAARGITGPSRTSRIRGRIERSEVADRIRSFQSDVQTFLDDTRAQQSLLGRSRSQRSGDSSSQGDVDIDESDVPTEYNPSRDDILEGSPRDRMSDDIAERTQTDVRETTGDFEGEGPAFRESDTATQPGDVDAQSYENLYGSPGQRELSNIQGDLRSMARREGRGGRAEPIVEDPVGVGDDSAVFPRQRAVTSVDAGDVVQGAAMDAAAGTAVSTAPLSSTGALALLADAQQPQVMLDATTPDGVMENTETSALDVDVGGAFATMPFAEDLDATVTERMDSVTQLDLDQTSDVGSGADSESGTGTESDVGTGSETDTGVDVTVGPDTGTDTDSQTGSATDTAPDTVPDTTTGAGSTPAETTPTDEPAGPGDTEMPPETGSPPRDPGRPGTPIELDPPGRPPRRGTPTDPPSRRPRPRPNLPDDSEQSYRSMGSVDLDIDEKTFEYDVASPSEVADGLDDDGDLDDDIDLSVGDSLDIDLDLDI